jgi:hypothetical protein
MVREVQTPVAPLLLLLLHLPVTATVEQRQPRRAETHPEKASLGESRDS